MAGVTIEGVSDCLRWMDEAPKDMVKLARKAMTAGCSAVKKEVKPRIDERWRPLVRSKVTGGNNDKDLEAAIGLFNGRQRSGHQPKSGREVDDWFKAYWKNYGTLSKRDPNHTFATPVRPSHHAKSRRRRNNVGQSHVNFFEAAIAGYETTFYDAFAKTIEKNIDDCYDR